MLINIPLETPSSYTAESLPLLCIYNTLPSIAMRDRDLARYLLVTGKQGVGSCSFQECLLLVAQENTHQLE